MSHTRKNGRVKYYLHTYEAGQRNRKYLSKKKEKQLIETLEKKIKERPVATRELQTINNAIKLNKFVAEKIIAAIQLPIYAFLHETHSIKLTTSKNANLF